MVNNQYFQGQFLQQLSKRQDHSWLAELPQEAQIRYVQMTASLTPQDTQSVQKLKQLEDKVKQDPVIGPKYTAFVARNPQLKPISESSLVLASNYL